MKVSVRWLYIQCKLTNQCSCPEFLAASCRCEIKVKLACSVVLGSRISSSFAELKGHEHVAKMFLGVNPLAQYNDEVLKSDYLTWKRHPNKICTRFLCLSFGSIKLLLLKIELVEK